MLLVLILFIFILMLLKIQMNQKPKGLPPGKWGLPIVGYAPFMNWRVTKSFQELVKEYGSIFTVKLGSEIVIVISDYSLIKGAFSMHELSGRSDFYAFKFTRKYADRGLNIATKGIWSINRKFAMKSLRDFGFGKSNLEELVQIEVENLVKDLKTVVNTPYGIDWSVNAAFLNIIWQIVASRRYDINDKEIKNFAEITSELVGFMHGPLSIFNVFPNIIPYIPGFMRNYFLKENYMRKKREELFNYFSKIVNEHKMTLNPNHPKDYIDAYLIEQGDQKFNPDYAHFDESNLLVELMDFFIAGSDTSSTLRWFFLYMAKYSEVQKRVQKEIDRVLPRDKLPSIKDKQSLPCLEALTCELARIVSLAPIGLPHGVLDDVSINGYNIPKGSIAVAYAESCHRDPKYWKHPNEFSLENFLDQEGKFVSKKEGFLPFSIGRRQCMGESLAKMELFLFMGAILQNFTISEPENCPVTLEPNGSIIMINHPPKCNVVLTNRI